MLTVAWYRFRATLRRQWTGYLAIFLLIGLDAGLRCGDLVSLPRFVTSTLTGMDLERVGGGLNS